MADRDVINPPPHVTIDELTTTAEAERAAAIIAPDVEVHLPLTEMPTRGGVVPNLNSALRPWQPTEIPEDVQESREWLVHHRQPQAAGGSTVALKGIGHYSGVLNPSQWQKCQQNRSHAVNTALAEASRLRSSCRSSEHMTKITTDQQQKHVTDALDERIRTVLNVREELHNTIASCDEEISLVLLMASATQRSKDSVDQAKFNSLECCSVREKRRGEDRTADMLAFALNQELRVQNAGLDSLESTLNSLRNQLARLRDLKRQLELDWSDKQETFQLDLSAAKLVTEPKQAQFKVSAGRQEGNSTPGSWKQRSYELISKTREEIRNSAKLRETAMQRIGEIAQDVIDADRSANLALAQRIEELVDAKQQAAQHATKILQECREHEGSIRSLQDALRSKENPLQVCQSRAWARNMRPGADKCLDAPHQRLLDELTTLPESIHHLRRQLHSSEELLSGLQKTHADLMQELVVKEHTLSLERRCSEIRKKPPLASHLRGLDTP